MNAFCQMCGKQIDGASPCPFCGYVSPDQQPMTEQQPPMQPQPMPPMNGQVPQFAPAPTLQNPPPIMPAPPAPSKPKKEKKKHKVPWILRFLIANVIIVGVLFGCWYAFGNMITLYIHSEEVVETLNSGSLELDGTQTAYDELPDYVKKMLGEDYVEEDYGPITKAVLPYISVKRAEINGFFNGSTVTYEISAPDLESWLLDLEEGTFTNEEELLSLMTQYMENAPLRTAEVEIKYEREGFFSVEWRGNYYTREFTDAICGGLNSAYNVLYEQAMDELDEFLSETKETDQ